MKTDVLTVGCACYDLIFSVPEHFGPDEKGSAEKRTAMGGGPAANAAVAASRLKVSSAFSGYLGNDIYGYAHIKELTEAGVNTRHIIRGNLPTSLSAILVKPDGRRTVVNHNPRSHTAYDYPKQIMDGILTSSFKAVLFDGHEPELSKKILTYCKYKKLPTILDAGSVRPGTLYAAKNVDYLITSETFAREYTGFDKPDKALSKMKPLAPYVVITLGNRGLMYHTNDTYGKLEAFAVDAIDTTGAGDVFHGAFAAGLIYGKPFVENLVFASAAAALCCTKTGARAGCPDLEEVINFLSKNSPGDSVHK